MDKKKPAIDIINEVLEECILAYPVSSFIISLYQQYQRRGSLSKKQLQGLHAKASSVEGFSHAKLGTLEAIIKRMPTRYKSEAPPPKPLYEKEEGVIELIEAVLSKFPQHKRVLFLQTKYQNNEMLTPQDLNDLKKFAEIASRK